MNYLVGKSLGDAEKILQSQDRKYIVKYIVGGKDTEILKEPFVVRAKDLENENEIELIVTEFKTTI